MNRNKIACNCNNVTYGTIEDAIKAGASSFEEVKDMTRCGKSCGKCQDFIMHLVKELIEEQGN